MGERGVSTGQPLFEPGEVIETARLRLGAATPQDAAALADWLGPAALAPDWEPASLEATLKREAGVVISDRTGVPIGLIVVLHDRPRPGDVSLPLVAVAPGRRFNGLGGEAALAVERRLRRRGVARVYAPVPDGRGLAVYFWLRLGYRPLSTGDAPWPLAGLSPEARRGIWMLREAD